MDRIVATGIVLCAVLAMPAATSIAPSAKNPPQGSVALTPDWASGPGLAQFASAASGVLQSNQPASTGLQSLVSQGANFYYCDNLPGGALGLTVPPGPLQIVLIDGQLRDNNQATLLVMLHEGAHFGLGHQPQPIGQGLSCDEAAANCAALAAMGDEEGLNWECFMVAAMMMITSDTLAACSVIDCPALNTVSADTNCPTPLWY